ncbi:hypothetical protein GUITHDRAFT_149626, partial [Guillardia theta CCMP2712]
MDMRLADFPLRGSRSSFQQPGPAARVVTLTLGYGWKRKSLRGEEEKRKQALLCNDDREIDRPRGLTPRARGMRRRKKERPAREALSSVSPVMSEERGDRRSQSVLAVRSRTPEEWKELVQEEVHFSPSLALIYLLLRKVKSDPQGPPQELKQKEDRYLPVLLTNKMPRSMLPQEAGKQVETLSGKSSLSVIFDSRNVPVLYKLRRKRGEQQELSATVYRKASVVEEKGLQAYSAGLRGGGGGGGGGEGLAAIAEKRRALEMERSSVLNDLAHSPQDRVAEVKRLLAKSPSSRFRYDCLKLALLLDFPSLRHLSFHRLADVLRLSSCQTVKQKTRMQLTGVGFLLEGEVVEFIVPAAVKEESIEDEHVLQLARQKRETTMNPLSHVVSKLIRQEGLSLSSHLTWTSAVDQLQPHLVQEGSLLGAQRLKNQVQGMRHRRAAEAMKAAIATRHQGSMSRLFRSIDVDNSESLDEEEVAQAFSRLGMSMTREEVRKAAKRAKIENKGSFSLQQFELLLESMLRSEEETSRMLDVDAFSLFCIVVSPSATIVELPLDRLARAQLDEEEDKLQAAIVSFLKEEGPLAGESSATFSLLAASSELRHLRGRKGEGQTPSCVMSSHEVVGGFALVHDGGSEEATETAVASSSCLHYLRIPVASFVSKLSSTALGRMKEMLRKRKQVRDDLLRNKLGFSSPPPSPLPDSLKPFPASAPDPRPLPPPRSREPDMAVRPANEPEGSEELSEEEEVSPCPASGMRTRRARDALQEEEAKGRKEYETLLEALRKQEETMRHEEEFESVSRCFLELFNSFKTEEEICKPKLKQAQVELRKYRAKRAFNKSKQDGSSLEDLRGFHVLMERVKELDNSLNHLVPVVKQMKGMVKHREEMEKRNIAYELFASASLLQAERTMLEYLQANPLTAEEEEEGDELLLSVVAMLGEGGVSRAPSEHMM